MAEFHDAVNMSSPELSEWLAMEGVVRGAKPEGSSTADNANPTSSATPSTSELKTLLISMTDQTALDVKQT
ncbi:hypothetical protein [Streptomyces sp. 6N223]|uniref:hypothetical protein n=1 Tax=Streptomyces sp. 6N223 TaxID=3457412 RepID=UPI003FD5CFC7